MNDPLLGKLVTLSRSLGMNTPSDLERLLDQPFREISEFERLIREKDALRAEIRAARSRVGPRGKARGARTGGEVFIERERVLARQIASQAETMRKIASELKGYLKVAAAELVLVELALLVVERLGEVWRYLNPVEIDPFEHDKSGCLGSGAEPAKGGMWNEEFSDSVFREMDEFSFITNQTWERMEWQIVAGVVRGLWATLEAEYRATIAIYTAKTGDLFLATKFGSGRAKKTRYGVHPRGT